MKRKIWWTLAAAVLLGWLLWANRALVATEYIIEDGKIPPGFSGYRIAQISDLHNSEFGGNNEKLLSLLKETQPDIILLTGDLVDSRRTDIQTALAFAEEAVKIAPCYYATGNHESRIPEYSRLEEGLRQLGVAVLRNEGVLLEWEGDSVLLAGVDDPAFSASAMAQALEELSAETHYTILLSHRPEYFGDYVQAGIELVFSGHVHGGQVRLPLVGGLVSPEPGLFPKYDAGVFTEGNTTMVVSRGIGNSILPLRINNRPEIVVAELRHWPEARVERRRLEGKPPY